jgi:hypothetical protein
MPEHYRVREAKGLHRKELGLDSDKKKRKLPMDNNAKKSMQELEDSVCMSSLSQASSPGLDNEILASEVQPAKKRRQCADQKIVQQCNDADALSGRPSRSKSKPIISHQSQSFTSQSFTFTFS